MSSAIPSTGSLIFISIKPLIRIILPAGAGFALIKTKVLPPIAPRIGSLMLLNVTLPSLLFSKIVPSFNSDNISALGPIFLVALFYQFFNLFLGIIVRTLTQTPRKFRYGFLSAFVFSNWGDLPTSVIQTITSEKPFNGTQDENIAIAYVAIFILVNYVSMFPLQGVQLVKMDYSSQVDAALELKYERHSPSWKKWLNRIRRGHAMTWELDEEEERQRGASSVKSENGEAVALYVSSRDDGVADQRRSTAGESQGWPKTDAGPSGGIGCSSYEKQPKVSDGYIHEKEKQVDKQDGNSTAALDSLAQVPSRSASVRTQHSIRSRLSVPYTTPNHIEPVATSDAEEDEGETAPPRSTLYRAVHWVLSFLRSLIFPPTVSLVLALIIALIPDVKALFVYVDGNSFNPTAPDGNPPLSIIYDTATFMGNASVPLGLLVLGCSLACMKIPKPFTRLPLASIVSMALLKMALVPVVGFFLVQGITKDSSMVKESNKVLRFTLIFFSCVPTATTQIAYTQIFGPADGKGNNADLLAAYLMAQYAVYAVSSTILTALTLNTLFN